MVISAALQTRARTIDHLGREQIADCPTAISELWKNAYDAYARNVSLNIFDGNTPYLLGAIMLSNAFINIVPNIGGTALPICLACSVALPQKI